MLEDKITIAVAGPIKAGKEVLVAQAQQHRDILFQALEGNYWVPQQLVTVKEQYDRELFEKYSSAPEKYAFQFQIQCMASRLAQQDIVDRSSGMVLLGQPLEIDRMVYAEANRENIAEAFPTYEALYQQVSRRVAIPNIWVYLQVTDVEVLKQRIRQHGLPGERKFLDDDSYLRRIIRLNEEFFGSVHQPVMRVDASHHAFDPLYDGMVSEAGTEEEYINEVFMGISQDIRRHFPPSRLSLNEWLAIDYNRAKKAAKSAQKQLQEYLRRQQTIMTLVGNVGCGKTGMAELLQDELSIGIIKELQGSNDAVRDELLSKFLRDKPRYCYELQRYLIPRRLARRKDFYTEGMSFVEDRSPVEDQSIFWKRFHQQGFLSDSQFKELQDTATKAYAESPKSNLMIQLHRRYQECRQMILSRGRPEEVKAWPEPELKVLEQLYDEFAGDMQQYGSHDGPVLDWNLEELQPENAIHQGFMWQEMHHALLEHRRNL